MVGQLGGQRLGVGLGALWALGVAACSMAACSSDDPKPSAAATAAGSSSGSMNGTSGAGGGASGATGGGAGGGAPVHMPPVKLADDESGITGLEDCALAQSGQCVKPLTRSKAEVCQRWNADRPQLAKTIQMPAASGCDPGTTVDVSIQDALRRFNLYRWVAGVEPVALNEEWNDFARSCAIIQSYLTPAISHYPEKTARCYTEQGYTASGQSELAGGSVNPAVAIDGLIFDTGDNNFHILGHRQGMLDPLAKLSGIGFAQPPEGSPATCVRIYDGSPGTATSGLKDVYSFPSPGHQPWELIAHSTYMQYEKLLEWSITVPPDVDASAAKVRLVRRKDTTWEELPVTSGKFLNEKLHGLWIIPGDHWLPPGTYAVIVSGTSLPTFGYQIVFDACLDAPVTCDVLAQNCGAGNGCYDPEQPYCHKSAGIAVGQPCAGWDNGECVAGAECGFDVLAGGYKCVRYCDPSNPASPKACATLCPDAFIEIVGEATLQTVGATCFVGAGGPCAPLAPQCDPGQSCAGFEHPACGAVGTTAAGMECDYIAGTCVAGSTCVGLQGSQKVYCQPYCDMAPTAAGPNACATLCPDDFWPYEGFGLCIPPD